MKRMIALLLLTVIMLSLHGCALGDMIFVGRRRSFENTPVRQIGTTWRSEDGMIQFTIVERDNPPGVHGTDSYGEGTMETDSGCVKIVFRTGMVCDVAIYLLGTDEILEKGSGDFKYSDQLTVTFTETTYLEENAVITFYRVDE